ncbi:MAG: c-type cytochrome, partial [Gammaproteobacteria bacterium]|nr:c-type cytochrome [Gammaproteobacteria bacterium]
TAALLALATAAPASEEEGEDEIAIPFEDKLAACAACHGEKGDKPIAPDYPILAGQHESYLAHALRAYKYGRRDNAIMMSQIQALEISDADIEKLAEYFAAQASPLTQTIAN